MTTKLKQQFMDWEKKSLWIVWTDQLVSPSGNKKKVEQCDSADSLFIQLSLRRY